MFWTGLLTLVTIAGAIWFLVWLLGRGWDIGVIVIQHKWKAIFGVGIGALVVVLGVVYGVIWADRGVTKLRSQIVETKTFRDFEAALSNLANGVGIQAKKDWLSSAIAGQSSEEGPPWQEDGDTESQSALPQATATQVPGSQVQPQAAQPTTERILVPPNERGQCWKTAAIQGGIQTATSGGTAWFPLGTTWSLEVKGGAFTRDYYVLSCPELGITDLVIQNKFGRQLRKITGSLPGNFLGSGQWPSSCYIEVAPSATPLPAPTSTPTPSPSSALEEPAAALTPTQTLSSVVRLTGSATFRAGPSGSAKLLGEIQQDNVLYLGEHVRGDSYCFGGSCERCKVQHNGQIGWIHCGVIAVEDRP